MFDSKPRKSKIGKYRKISIPNKFRKSRIRINRTRKVSCNQILFGTKLAKRNSTIVKSRRRSFSSIEKKIIKIHSLRSCTNNEGDCQSHNFLLKLMPTVKIRKSSFDEINLQNKLKSKQKKKKKLKPENEFEAVLKKIKSFRNEEQEKENFLKNKRRETVKVSNSNFMKQLAEIKGISSKILSPPKRYTISVLSAVDIKIPKVNGGYKELLSKVSDSNIDKSRPSSFCTSLSHTCSNSTLNKKRSGSSKHRSDSTLKCQKILEIDNENIKLESKNSSNIQKKIQLDKYPLPIPEETTMSKKIILSIPQDIDESLKKSKKLNKNEIKIGKISNTNYLNPSKEYSYRKDLNSICKNPKVFASSHPGYKQEASIGSDLN